VVGSKESDFWDVKHVMNGRFVRIHRECLGTKKAEAPILPLGFIRSIQTHEPVGDGEEFWRHVIQDDEIAFWAGGQS